MKRTKVLSGLLAAALIGVPALMPTPALAAGGPNLAAGKAATASSTNANFVAANVLDGNPDSYWESAANAFPSWIQIDLGAGADVDQVKLKLPPATAWATRTQTLTVQGGTN